jgi:hypothetical protein
MGQRNTERMAKESRYRKPIGNATYQGSMSERTRPFRGFAAKRTYLEPETEKSHY